MHKSMESDIKQRTIMLRDQYSADLSNVHLWEEDAARVTSLYRKGATIVDLGGGISAHNGVLAELGMTVYVVDLMADYWEHRDNGAASIAGEIRLLEQCGVRFIANDISICDLKNYFADNSIDIVTSFHCIEHLHSSPRLVLESAMQVLKPGGKMVIEVPNAANLRKRLALLCGHTNYGPYNSLYYSHRYLGHIREYTTGDLHQLARNLEVSRYSIHGRNAIHGQWVERIPNIMRKCFDRLLQVAPGLCGALGLEITKSNQIEMAASDVDSERTTSGDKAMII